MTGLRRGRQYEQYPENCCCYATSLDLHEKTTKFTKPEKRQNEQST